IHNEYLWLQTGGDAESESHPHARGITLHRRVDKFVHFRESDNLIKLAIHFFLSHPQYGAVQVNVLAPGEIGMKTSSYFQEAAYTTVDGCASTGRVSDLGKDFEQRAFARAILTNDPQDLSVIDLERNIV